MSIRGLGTRAKCTGLPALLLFLLLLCIPAFAPGWPHVVDAVTGAPVEQARLEPLDPVLRAWLEPLYGPLHAFSALPLWRLLSWLVWLAAGIFLFRFVRRLRNGEGWKAALGRETLCLTGVYAPVAAVPKILYVCGLLPLKVERLLTPVGLPLAVCGTILVIRLWRDRRNPRRILLGVRTVAGMIGVIGWILLGLLAVAYDLLPGLFQTGDRLVPPPGLVVADVHAHFQDRDTHAHFSGPDYLALFSRHGIGIAAATDHNRFDLDPSEATIPTLRRAIRDRGLPLTLIPGEEFSTPASHLVLLGTRRRYAHRDYQLPGFDDLQKTPPTYGIDYPRLIADVHRDGGYVVAAHWWRPDSHSWIDWEQLAKWGVDGFEIASGADRAPASLVDAWRRRGVLLFSGSDFHGWRKSLYGWNLVDASTVNPEGKPLPDLDPYVVVERMFRSRGVRPVVANAYDPAVPAWLEPPAGAWHYVSGLRPSGRVAWAGVAILTWLLIRASRGRKKRTDVHAERASCVDTPEPGIRG
jgi:hypothetical protein